MGPWDSPEVHHGERPDDKHERRAEVRLQENHPRREQSEGQISDGSAHRRARPGAVDDEAGEGQDEQELGQLGGLEGEEREFEGAPRAERGGADDEDQPDRYADEGVDADPQLAEARVVDATEDQHPDHADDPVDRLALEVVVRAAGDVGLGRLAEGEDAESDQPDRGEGEGEVHVGEAEAFGDRRPVVEELGPRLARPRRVHHPMPPLSVSTGVSSTGASSLKPSSPAISSPSAVSPSPSTSSPNSPSYSGASVS